jgi:hypothetical protein
MMHIRSSDKGDRLRALTVFCCVEMLLRHAVLSLCLPGEELLNDRSNCTKSQSGSEAKAVNMGNIAE